MNIPLALGFVALFSGGLAFFGQSWYIKRGIHSALDSTDSVDSYSGSIGIPCYT